MHNIGFLVCYVSIGSLFVDIETADGSFHIGGKVMEVMA